MENIDLATLKEATSFGLLAFAFLWGLFRITKRLEEVSDSLRDVRQGMASTATSMQVVADALKDVRSDVEILKERKTQ